MIAKQTIAPWIQQAKTSLNLARPEEPISSLYAILQNRTGLDMAHLLANQTQTVDEADLTALSTDLEALLAGTPLAHLLGKWEFYGLEFIVSPDVLIPRPETELLVESALEYLKAIPGTTPMIADVGTGSGCIAISIALNAREAKVIAVDISERALDIAKRNCEKYDLCDQIAFQQDDLLTSSEQKFDLICANLPYIPSKTTDDLPVSEYEPRLALDGGPDGLILIEKLMKQAKTRMKDHGCLLFEFEYRQGPAILALAGLHFPQATSIINKDMAGHDRILSIQF